MVEEGDRPVLQANPTRLRGRPGDTEAREHTHTEKSLRPRKWGVRNEKARVLCGNRWSGRRRIPSNRGRFRYKKALFRYEKALFWYARQGFRRGRGAFLELPGPRRGMGCETEAGHPVGSARELRTAGCGAGQPARHVDFQPRFRGLGAGRTWEPRWKFQAEFGSNSEIVRRPDGQGWRGS
jgi:hypothetical protein